MVRIAQMETYLGQLMPIKVMPIVKFEDEDVIDLSLRPDPTV